MDCLETTEISGAYASKFLCAGASEPDRVPRPLFTMAGEKQEVLRDFIDMRPGDVISTAWNIWRCAGNQTIRMASPGGAFEPFDDLSKDQVLAAIGVRPSDTISVSLNLWRCGGNHLISADGASFFTQLVMWDWLEEKW